MPYPMNNNASSHKTLKVGSTYLLSNFSEDDSFKLGKRLGRVLQKGSGSVLVRWSAHEETDWEGNKEKRNAYVQRIALNTEVEYIDSE
tara:strand:- start:2066 stop:2329 length:264 start_codon:yes stop_codon:yes gene_type:complete